MDDIEVVNILIDPSLILAENSMMYTFNYMKKASVVEEKYKFYLPKSLLQFIDEQRQGEDTPGINFFLHGATPAEMKELRILIDRYSGAFSLFDPEQDLVNKHGEMAKSLHTELYERGELWDENLFQILFEEWVFLFEYSWVVSRIKKPFNRFFAAGAVCMQFSQRTVDMLIRRILRKDKDYYLDNVDKLRALGKWIAVGVGAPALGSISPWLSGIPGLILLFDPESRTPMTCPK